MILISKVPDNSSSFDLLSVLIGPYTIIIIIIIIIILCEFFTPTLANGLSLESKWQQGSSKL